MKNSAVVRSQVCQAAIVVAEFFGTSLWFSATAVSAEISEALGRHGGEPLDLSSAVQIGFVSGTLLIGLTGLADRFRASSIFAASAVFGAAANALIAALPMTLAPILICRFATGVALAGVYPIGMKLAVSWNRNSAGRVLGWLVAMLTLGTAAPYLMHYLNTGQDWRLTILGASVLACAAALIALITRDGPDIQSGRRARIEFAALLGQFKLPKLAAASLGYLGHMWELYAFWCLVPFLVASATRHEPGWPVSLLAFLVISAGALGSVIGGIVSRAAGSRAVALIGLSGSAAACAIVPVLDAPWLLLTVLFIWGFLVIPDSPQLSSLAVEACNSDQVASTLAILNGTGFLLTAVSIKLTLAFWPSIGPAVAWLLLPGPLAGLLALVFLEDILTKSSQARQASQRHQ